MIILATNEIYKISVKVGITGDKETKNKLNAIETMADQTKKKLEALNSINASPTVKLNDQASSKLDALEAKINKVKNSKAAVKVGAKDEASGVISKIGEKINGLVKAGAKKIISFGVTGVEASLKNYMEYEKSLSDVKAITNATGSEMKILDANAKELGSSTKWSATSVAEAEKTLAESGISVKDTVSALPGILNLATAGGIDLATAAEIASSTLAGFNLKGSDSAHVADVLASSASETKSDLGELGNTMKDMAPISSSLGISLEDTAVATGLLSGQNIKGSQAATMLKQTIGKLASPTKEASEMMKRYNINAYDTEGKMKPLSGVVDNLNSSLGNLTDQQKEDAIATIFGVDNMSGIFALMNQGGKSFDELSKKVQNAQGLSKEIADTKMDTLVGQWDRLKAAATTMSVTLGEKLAPYAKEFINWLIEKMPVIEDKIIGIVDYVSKNTEEVKALATTVAALGVVFAGLGAVGNLANAFNGITSLLSIFKGASVAAEAAELAGGLGEVGAMGSLLPAIFTPAGAAVALAVAGIGIAVVANNNLMKKRLGTTTEELGPVERIMNGLHGHIYKSKEEMQQLGLVYEDFGDNISDNFKRKVEESTKSIREFQFFINKINLDGVISESESSDFDNKVNEMCYSAINTIEDNKAKSQEAMKAMFMDDGTFSDSEKATLDYLSKDSNDRVTKEQQLRDKIYDIRKKAIARNGQLDETDKEQIKQLQTEMAQIALESAGGNTDELLYAKNKFKARAEGASLEDGSGLAKEAAKDRDDRIVDVKAKYDTNIDKLKAELASATTNTDKDNLNKTIIENEQAKANKISEINKIWNEDLDSLYKANPKLKGRINKYDGSILNGKDTEDQNSLEDIKKNYPDLNGVTEEGFYGVKGKNGAMNSIYVSVDKETKEMTGAWNSTTGETGAYTDVMRKKVEELANANQDTFGNAIKYLGDMGAKVNTSSMTLENSSQYKIGELKNISTNYKGITTSTTEVDGNKIQITSNADGTIASMKQVAESVDAIPPSKIITIETISNGGTISAGGMAYGEQDGARFTGKETTEYNGTFLGGLEGPHIPMYHPDTGLYYANGTNNAERGVATVAEEGYEIVFGRQKRWFNGGEKVLNHKQSKTFLENQQNNEPFQVKQGQYQVFQPQMQVAGAGGVSVGDIQVSVNGNQDANGIVQEVVQVVIPL